MVDVRLSNNKLFFRAIKIVSEITQQTEAQATTHVLSAIYNTTKVEDKLLLPPSEHIAAAFKTEKVVPTALLLARGKHSLEEIRELLQKQPIVRKLF
jgi:hypothetical protein